VDAMLARLDALRTAFADDREIALEEAKAAFNVTSDAGAQQDWPRVDAMLPRLDALRTAFADDREIALAEAKAAVNVTNHAGAQQDWPRVDAMLARLDALRTAFADDREIALEEAKAAFNVTYAAGAQQDWPRVVEMEKRCAKLEQNFADDAATLGMTSEQRVLAYYARRAHGQYPAEDVTNAAVQSAMLRILASLQENSEFMLPQCAQVIADARRRFPESAEIEQAYDQLTAAGMDWSMIPAISA